MTPALDRRRYGLAGTDRRSAEVLALVVRELSLGA